MALDLSALDQAPIAPMMQETAQRAPLDAFEEDPDNPRFEHDESAFLALVESVRAHGILQPVVVLRQADGKLRIRFGARRLRSARALGLPDLPYVVTDDERQFDDYAQVAENEQRAPLQPLELARFVERRLACGESKRAIAQRLGKDPSALTHLLSLAGEPPAFLLALYEEHRCRTPQYLYDLRRLSEQNPGHVAQACEGSFAIDRQFILELTLSLAAADAAAGDAGAGNQATVIGRPSADNVRTEPVASVAKRVATPRAKSERLRVTLVGRVGDQQVTLQLHKRPSAPDRLLVLDDTGACFEVAIDAIQLTAARYGSAVNGA